MKNILQGWQDSPLTERGREQALATRAAFEARGVTFDHVYSSPLGRARCTAELIVGEGRSIELVDELREWHLGSLEGTSNREMPAQPWGDYPVAFGEFLEYAAGGGEQPDNGAVLHFGYCGGAFSLLDW